MDEYINAGFSIFDTVVLSPVSMIATPIKGAFFAVGDDSTPKQPVEIKQKAQHDYQQEDLHQDQEQDNDAVVNYDDIYKVTEESDHVIDYECNPNYIAITRFNSMVTRNEEIKVELKQVLANYNNLLKSTHESKESSNATISALSKIIDANRNEISNQAKQIKMLSSLLETTADEKNSLQSTITELNTKYSQLFAKVPTSESSSPITAITIESTAPTTSKVVKNRNRNANSSDTTSDVSLQQKLQIALANLDKSQKLCIQLQAENATLKKNLIDIESKAYIVRHADSFSIVSDTNTSLYLDVIASGINDKIMNLHLLQMNKPISVNGTSSEIDALLPEWTFTANNEVIHIASKFALTCSIGANSDCNVYAAAIGDVDDHNQQKWNFANDGTIECIHNGYVLNIVDTRIQLVRLTDATTATGGTVKSQQWTCIDKNVNRNKNQAQTQVTDIINTQPVVVQVPSEEDKKSIELLKNEIKDLKYQLLTSSSITSSTSSSSDGGNDSSDIKINKLRDEISQLRIKLSDAHGKIGSQKSILDTRQLYHDNKSKIKMMLLGKQNAPNVERK